MDTGVSWLLRDDLLVGPGCLEELRSSQAAREALIWSAGALDCSAPPVQRVTSSTRLEGLSLVHDLEEELDVGLEAPTSRSLAPS